MDWITAILHGLQEDQQIKIAIVKTNISLLTHKLQSEEEAFKAKKISELDIQTTKNLLELWQKLLEKLDKK